MKQPPSIQPDPVPGPGYDPMDRIVQDLQNVESFLLMLSSKNKEYLDTHLSSILALRRSISEQLEKLGETPYDYSSSRLKKLHQQNEQLFVYVEGVVGELMAKDRVKFKKLLETALQALSDFDDNLTV